MSQFASFPSRSTRKAADADCSRAFTVIELLIVILVLALMISLVAAARAASRPNFQGTLCLNNLRQMMAAFTMYTHDNSDLFPPNGDLAPNPGCNWAGGVASGWLPVGSSGNVDAGNPDLLRDPRRSLLTSYIRTNISLFRCPFDPRVCPYTEVILNCSAKRFPWSAVSR